MKNDINWGTTAKIWQNSPTLSQTFVIPEREEISLSYCTVSLILAWATWENSILKKKKKTKLVHTRHALHRFPKQHWEHTHSSLTKVLCFYFEKMFPYSTNGCGFIWGILLFESSYFCYALTPLYLFCLLVWLFKKCLFAGLYALMNINFICRTIKRNWGRGGRSLKERKTQWPERPVVF